MTSKQLVLKYHGSRSTLIPTSMIIPSIHNKKYRHIFKTSPNKKNQIVFMHLKPNESIDLEKHDDTDQYFYISSGECLLATIIDGVQQNLLYQVQQAFIVKKGFYHKIINLSKTQPLKLITVYMHVAPHKYDQIEKPNE